MNTLTQLQWFVLAKNWVFGGVYRGPVGSSQHHRPKKNEVVAALFVAGTGDYSHLEASFQLEQPRVSGQQIVRPY